MSDLDLDDLRSALADFAPEEKKVGRSPREERVIAGFEEIVRFYEEHGRAPLHGEERDIFERLYAVRLDRIRELPDCREIVAPLDKYGLLEGAAGVTETGPAYDADALRAELAGDFSPEDDITQLRHVRPREEIRAAEEISNRRKCEDFAAFKPLIEAVRRDLRSGIREARRFGENAQIKLGEFFILGGQIAYVAAVPEEFTTEHGHAQGRLRVIFDNGTEGDPLLRSFQRALYKDETGQRITDPDIGPLFGDTAEADDLPSGTIYVLRSLSDDPRIAAARDVIHKIGVTGGSVEARIANARKDATYLLADVEVVATYKLLNINRSKLEAIFHRVFGAAQLDITINDRLGFAIKPREWFLAPLPVIDEVVRRIQDGSITSFVYDPVSARLTPSP